MASNLLTIAGAVVFRETWWEEEEEEEEEER